MTPLEEIIFEHAAKPLSRHDSITKLTLANNVRPLLSDSPRLRSSTISSAGCEMSEWLPLPEVAEFTFRVRLDLQKQRDEYLLLQPFPTEWTVEEVDIQKSVHHVAK
jgi:hypothetical protein